MTKKDFRIFFRSDYNTWKDNSLQLVALPDLIKFTLEKLNPDRKSIRIYNKWLKENPHRGWSDAT